MLNDKKTFVLNILSIAIMIYGVSMLPSIVIAIRYNEIGVLKAMASIAFTCIPLGFFGYRFLPNNMTDARMSVCYTTTLMTWIVVILLTALPYITSGMGYRIIDCFFESVASWTTTGASAIPTATLPKALKLWRSTCNWMGGIGIILLTLTFLPSWQFVGQKLASTEIRGPSFLMSTTTFRKAYRRILFIYLGITVAHYIALRATGMAQFTSLLTSLSNVSTSGLQHLNNGVIINQTLPVKIVITLFAFIGSINISTLVILLVGKFKSFLNNSELKMYLVIIAASTLLLTMSISIENHGKNIPNTLGNIFMQVLGFTSTAGYIITPCVHWNAFCIGLCSVVMFMGACAISTGGGIKVSRVVFGFKSLSLAIYNLVHPKSIRTVLYNKKPIENKFLTRSNMYVAVFLLLYFIGGIAISADGTEAYTALSYSQAMLTNVGSPISQLADPGIVADMSTYSKSIMCFLMLCGRLEIYPVMMIFSANLWRSNDSKRDYEEKE